jgi:hypothetical protein
VVLRDAPTVKTLVAHLLAGEERNCRMNERCAWPELRGARLSS